MFDHWLLEEMQALCASMGWPNPCPEWRRARPTQERFGVHSISSDMRGASPSAEGAGEEPDLVDEETVALEEMLEEQRVKSLETIAGETCFTWPDEVRYSIRFGVGVNRFLPSGGSRNLCLVHLSLCTSGELCSSFSFWSVHCNLSLWSGLATTCVSKRFVL